VTSGFTKQLYYIYGYLQQMNREKIYTLVTDLLYFGFPNGFQIFLARSKKIGEVSLRLKKFPDQIVLRCGTSDFDTFDQVFKSREYQLPLEISGDGVIIDAGANIGLASIWLSKRYPGTKVLALEPEQSNYDLMVRNTRRFPNIVCLRNALWNRDEMVHLHDPSRDKWGFTVIQKPGPGNVEGITITSLMSRYQIESIDLLKMDIEGTEVELFSAPDTSWLLKTKSLAVELHDRIRRESSRSFLTKILEHDFLIEARGEKLFCFR
jgi:FkbM family methyltransferase